MPILITLGGWDFWIKPINAPSGSIKKNPVPRGVVISGFWRMGKF